MYLESWSYNSRAIFNLEKIILMCFPRNKFKLIAKEIALAYIRFGKEIIKPKPKLKLLKVVFDQKLIYKYYIIKAAKRGIKIVLALK